ncbi:tRNA-modifying protein YgfZ [Moellerella wisconsensis]|uniref:tRNA-modifying protein YgfZ n=1 Tax=Moellerella wisconsensis TaxID=158849 RepID=UPI0025B10D31|nr:tRNA-modifying protein YgfZ [Moellerella wisconsensis]WJW81091.1 tRNA-modifying protein YgfZ [Moellerella wisconsensis]
MNFQIPFSHQIPISYQSLPLTLISLEDWGLVNITGADSEKYLQGQVTADIAALASHQHTLSAHCDAKGKMWSDLRLFHRGEGYAYIERESVIEGQLAELKKYAVFSKVSMSIDNDSVMLGIAGLGARLALEHNFSSLPDDENQVITINDSLILHFSLPSERFLIITTPAEAEKLANTLTSAQRTDSAQWLSLDIEAGFAIIDAANSAQFIPQATNLQALPAGICFKKGCYTGQEMVARAKFRGANKRAMYWLKGTATNVPVAGDDLEWQLGDKWRRTGTVLSAVRLNDESINLQVVMNNDMEAESVFRVKGDENSHLTIQPLPYSLDEEK